MRLIDRKVVQVVIACLLLIALPVAAKVANDKAEVVLVIDSYHVGLAESEKFFSSLNSALKKATVHAPELYIVSLDSGHYSIDVTAPWVSQEIRKQFSMPPAAIVINGMPALMFFQRYRHTLFVDVPAVFTGVFNGQIDEEILQSDTLLTGVISQDPLARTLELAAKLHPKSSRILVVGDSGPQVDWEQQRTITAQLSLARSLFVEFLAHWDTSTLDNKISELTDNNVVVTTSSGERNPQARFTPEAMLQHLNISGQPIYTTDRRLIDAGAIGGYSADIAVQGQLVADYLQRIMTGESPSELPYLYDQTGHAVFNASALAQFKIEPHLLPSNAEVRRSQAQSVIEYAGLLLVLLVIVWLLYRFLIRSNASLLARGPVAGMDEATLLRILLNSNSDLIYAKNRRGQYIECNQAFNAFTGSTYGGAMGDTVSHIFDDTKTANVVEHDQEVYQKEQAVHRETWLQNSQGKSILFESLKAPLRNSRNEIVGLIGIDRDMTGRYYENILLKQSNRILDMIIRGVSLPSILLEITKSFEQIFPDSRCSVVLIDREQRRFIHGAAPSLPSFYNHALDGLEFGVGIGSCGTAAATGKPVIVDNVNSSPYWEAFLDLAHQLGIVSVWSYPVIGSSGNVLAIFTVYHDESRIPNNNDDQPRIEQAERLVRLALERKQVEGDLQKLSRAVEQSPTMVLITDAQGVIEYVNEEFTEVTGYALDEIRGLTPAILNAGETDDDFYRDMWKTISTGHDWHGEIRNKTKSGQSYWSMLSISPIVDENGDITHYIGVSEDISAQKKTQEQIEQLAFYDPLTRLGNRRLFRQQLEVELKKSARNGALFALFYLDLDNFKQVNDTLGHDVGDRLLQTVAERLRYVLRNSDFISRLGGDEFIALLPDIAGPKEAQVVADKLLQALCQPVYLGSTEVEVTVSLGITLAPVDGGDWSVLMKNADLAMYRAKHEGRNNYQFFTQEMNEEVLHRVEMEKKLRRALENQEFCLHYQPQWNILNELKPVCLEALVRWEHPDQGYISPADFIPIAEDLGLIVELGDWILQQACFDGQRLIQSGHHINIAVNLSMRQFFDPQLLQKVESALQRSGFPATCLELEITESMLMDDVQLVRTTLERLKELGVSLAIDDFGTGYSSLGYLKALPFDQLKVDASFVQDIPIDKNDMEITAAVIAMAHKLGLRVVAEGIETQEQLAFLRNNHCEMGQGYLLARPAPFDDVLVLLDVEFDPDLGW